ncbi:MAG: hypothetical protein E6Q97_31115 [Desulfurellales bacterium]|nr:MAG: hypothetical protein E6Q97_31115 [Desulfurellales bacterium]
MTITARDNLGNVLEFPDGTPDDVVKREAEIMFRRLGKTQEKPSQGQSFMRGLREGATFGFDGRVSDDWRDERETSRKENPWTHTGGEIIGAILPAILSRGRTVEANTAAWAPRVGNTVARGAARTLDLIAPQLGNTVGQTALRNTRAGAVQGFLSGVGHADTQNTNGFVDWLGEQLKGGVQGTIVGGGIGLATSPIVHGIGRLLQNRAAARAAARSEAEEPHQGALNTVAKALERDDILPADLAQHVRDNSLPPAAGRFGQRGAGQWTPQLVEDVADIVLSNPGINAAGVRGQLAARMTRPGAPPPVLPGDDAIRTFMVELERRSAPLNLVDRSGMQGPGSGENMQWTMRAAANTPGRPRAMIRENLVERQLDAGDRIGQRIGDTVGRRDFERVADQHRETLARTGAEAYRRAAENERPFDLRPVVQQSLEGVENRRGPVPEAVRRAIDSLHSDVPIAGPGANNRQIPGFDLSGPERETVLAAWRSANQRVRRPEGLSDWVARYARGGILDPGGDVQSVAGNGHRLSRLARGNRGMSLDDIAVRAQEEGFFPPGPRPTIRELLDALHDDLGGNAIVRQADYDALEQIAQATRTLNDLRDAGFTARTEQELLEQLGMVPGGRAPRTEARLPQNLEEFTSARQNVRQMLDDEEAKRPLVAGARQNSPVFRALTQFYRDITEAVASENPAWAHANRLWRDGNAATEALDQGSKLALRLNDASRESLRDLERLAGIAAQHPDPLSREAATAQLRLFRVGFARSLMDRLVNNKDATHDLVRELSRPGARQIVEAVLGRRDAVTFLRAMEAEQQMYRTFRSQYGSQTTPLREAIDDQQWAPRLLAAGDWWKPHKLIQAGLEWSAARYNAARNEAMVPMLLDQNPVNQLRTLRAVEGVSRARQNTRQAITGVGLTNLPGATTEVERGSAHHSRNPPRTIERRVSYGR